MFFNQTLAQIHYFCAANNFLLKNFLKNTIQSQKVFYRYFRRKGWKRFFKENILETDGSNKTKALSIALGIFVGLTPLFGFHTVIVLFLASFFKLNKLLSYMCTHISAPPFIPFIVAISLFFGAPFVSENQEISNQEINLEYAKTHFTQYLIGSLIFACVASLLLGFIAYFIFEKFKSSPKTNP